MSIMSLILFGCIVFLTFTIEGITGFGSIVLALPFCTLLTSITTAVPALMALDLLLCLYIAVIDYKNVIWKKYFKIVCFVLLGLPIGIWGFTNLPEYMLKCLLGVFMICVAVRGLYTSWHGSAEVQPGPMSRTKNYLLDFLLFFGGITHGAFGAGGPFVIIYASQVFTDKSQFRATLCMMWVTLDVILVANNFKQGFMTSDVWDIVLSGFPFLFAGMLAGNWGHHRIDGQHFTKLVYIVLLCSGFLMFR